MLPTLTVLLVAEILIMSMPAFTSIANAQQGEIQEESDGGLTATLNGNSFRRGDTITVTGTVGEREPDSSVVIEVIDPRGETVEYEFPDVTADNTFQHSFIPGEEEAGFLEEPLTESGNYRMVLTYFPPGDEIVKEELEFVFVYEATPRSTTTTPGGGGPAQTITAPTGTTFQSTDDSFSIQVPEGWIIHDINNTGPALLEETRQGYGILVSSVQRKKYNQQFLMLMVAAIRPIV